MHSIAFRLLAEEVDAESNRQGQPRAIRKCLRDSTNPLEWPETLYIGASVFYFTYINTFLFIRFQKYYRVNKVAFKYLLELLTTSRQPTRKRFAISPIVKLSACLRFFAEGGYQTGVGIDHNIGLAQSTFSKELAEVLDVLEAQLCPQWISVYKTVEEKRNVTLPFYTKYSMPGIVGCIDGTHVRIVAPSVNKHLFYNRKGTYSLNVMLVNCFISAVVFLIAK